MVTPRVSTRGLARYAAIELGNERGAASIDERGPAINGARLSNVLAALADLREGAAKNLSSEKIVPVRGQAVYRSVRSLRNVACTR
jgi:hypothetical protein